MAGANEKDIRGSRRRPRTSMKVEMNGAGGILVLGGAIIAAAFAAHRARTARKRGAAASTSSNAMPRVQQGEHSTALPGSGSVADGGLHGDGSLCGAALADERKEQTLLKADVETSCGFVFELEKADVMSHEDRTSRESDHSFVSTEHQIREIKSEESELVLDGSKVSDVVIRAKEDSSSESPFNEQWKQMQVISDGFMMVQELEQDTLAAASHFSIPECYPELKLDGTKSVHVTEMEDSQESEILLEGSKLSDVENRANEDSSSESSVNERSKQVEVISDGFMMVKELDQDTSATVSHFSMPQCYLERRIEEAKGVRVAEIDGNPQESELLLDDSKFSNVVNRAKDSSSESSLNEHSKQMQVISGGFMMVQEMEQDTPAAASHFSMPQCHPELKIEETKVVHVTEIEDSQEPELLLDGSKFSDAGNRPKEDSSSASSLNDPWKHMQVISGGGVTTVQELERGTSAAATHFSVPHCHPDLKIDETKAVHVTEMEEDAQESELLSDGPKFSDVGNRAKEDSSSESSLDEHWKQMQVISDGFMMVEELEKDTSPATPHLSMLQCHPELKIEETKVVHVTEIDEDSQEESPVLTEPFMQVEDLSDEEESDMKDEGSDISLVSSSSSSGSSAEPIWPAEVIEQEKSVVSTDLMNDPSSELEIFEEVKDMVHSEDSGEVITDTTLTKEEIKPKVNAIRRSGTIVVFKNNSKGFLPRRLLLLLLAAATALGLISMLDKGQLITDHLIELCNKFFHAIFASSDNKYGF